jgi:hypothetical protein
MTVLWKGWHGVIRKINNDINKIPGKFPVPENKKGRCEHSGPSPEIKSFRFFRI